MTGLESAHRRRRADSSIKRARVSEAIQLALARGEVPTISSVARAAGVDRSIFYGVRGQPLRAELDLAVTRLRADAQCSTGRTAQVTAAVLRADLANANELNRRLRQRLLSLEKALSRQMGEQLISELPTQRRAALLADADLRAELDFSVQKISTLEEENSRLREELDGARRANRDLTRQLNAAPPERR